MRVFVGVLVILQLCLTSCTNIENSNEKSDNHFFVFGGGYSAFGNQISLEKNVTYINSIMEENSPLSVTRLFADGREGSRSTQYILEDTYPNDFQKLIISCLGSTKRVSAQYRPHILEDVQGPLKRKEIDKYFAERAGSFEKEDKLILYYTGHGGRGSKKAPQDTSILLWHDGSYKMKDFVTKLQALPVPTVCVMVQCFSGGFQNMVFKEGDPKKGLTEKPVCGFFSTVYSRVAAGCTPKIDDADYQEYSTWFWAGLAGYNRQGKILEKPDYNKDGVVSFDEAHNYTLINLDSIDIPTKTSEIILRTYRPKKAPPLEITKLSELSVYLKFADPGQKEVIKKLSVECGLGMKSKILDLVSKIKTLSEKIKKRQLLSKALKKTIIASRLKAGRAVRHLYPELYNPFHGDCRAILESHEDDLKKGLSQNKDFLDYKAKYKKGISFQEESYKIDREFVVKQRLLLTMSNVLNEPYFLKHAKPDIVKAYLRVRNLEKGHL